MPFIRYVIGDIGIAGGKPCSCGRTLPVMRVVEGRHADCLTLPDGRVVSPYVVTCAIERVRGVAQYQVVQDAPAELEVRLAGGPGAAVRQAVRDALAAALGPGLSVRVTPCDALRPEPGGKYRVVMSRVGAPHIALVRCSSAGYGLEPGITEVPCS
jgi:phenylacetate-CoA ligase